MLSDVLTVNDKSYDLKILFDLSGKKLDLSEFDQMVEAQLRSYQFTGIDTSKFDFQSLFSNQQSLIDLRSRRSNKLALLFQEIQDPDVFLFYERFRPFINFLHNKINNQKLITDLRPNIINFNATGSRDARLSTKKGSLKLFSLPKEERHQIKSDPDFRFVQCDYKSFQPRLAIFLTKNDAFRGRFEGEDDIYQGTDREKAKLDFLRVMFGFDTSNRVDLKPILDLRKSIFEEIQQTGKILNPYGRPIWHAGEDENAVFHNFITSCESDFVFDVAVRLDNLLNGKRSRIKWLFHDSIMFEVHKNETDLLKKIKVEMENNNIFNVRFPIKMSMGKNFGELRDLS